MSTRDEILGRLRETLAQPELRFPPASTPPLTRAERMTVTKAPVGPLDLAHRFGEELVALHGSYEIVDSPAEARLTLLNRLVEWMEADHAARKGAVIETGQERSILAWDTDLLPIDGLGPALEDMSLQLVTPGSLQSDEEREAVRFIRYGVTGVDAAIASTGTMIAWSGKGKSRAASLLPYYHVGLIPLSRLYPTVEHWLAERREAGDLVDLLRQPRQLDLDHRAEQIGRYRNELDFGRSRPQVRPCHPIWG